MKTRLIVFIMILVICLTPVNAFAEEDLMVSSWIVEANLLEDGSLSIIKDITYDFNSAFNGVYVDINLDDIIEVDHLQIYEIISGEEMEYTRDQNAQKGQTGVFSTDLTNSNMNIMIFSPSEDESKTFRLKYTLNNVAAVHSDVGELYYKFIGSNNDTPIAYFRANIDLPRFNQEEIKIFAHGPLNGEIYFNNEDIILEVNDIPRNTFVEARILFPLDYIPNATRSGNSSFNVILDEERALENQIQENEDRRQERKSLFNSISSGLSIVSLLVFGFILNKFRRKPDIFEDMNSLYPDDISPAELSLFMSSTTGPRAYMATLLDLARREYLSFEIISSKSKSSKKMRDSYLFIKNNSNLNPLKEHENFLMDWLFNEIGNGSRVSTDEINDYRKKHGNKFYKSQTSWLKIVRDELNTRDYHDPKGKKYGITLLIFSLVLFIVSIISLVHEGLFGILLLFVSIILMVYGIFMLVRRSDRGYIQYRLWKDFKKNNSMVDAQNIGLSTDLSLIYLIALGLPMKDLDDYRQSVGMDYYPMHWGYFYFLTNSRGGSRFEDNFNNSFYGSTGSSTSSSSSFGGGGGFTGGGGGGVGGSGTGGF